MKKSILFLLTLLMSSLVYGQIKQAGNRSPLTTLQKQGWDIHSHTLSYDEQTIVFSGKAPQDKQYDLYIARRKGNVWENVQPLSFNTPADELYPTLSSSEETLLFVKRTEDEGKGKKPMSSFYLMHTNQREGIWSTPEVIIISEGQDISPLLMPDNKTVLFASRRITETKKEENFALFYTRRIDENNWYNPILVLAPEDKNSHYYGPYIERIVQAGNVREITIGYTHQLCAHRDTTYQVEHFSLPEKFHPLPVLTIEGKIREHKTHRIVPAQINVFHAISFKPLARVKSSSFGTYKVALPHGVPYFIDFTGENYSHYYCEHSCIDLKRDSVIKKDIELDKQLNIRINAFDSEVLLPLSPDRILLNGGTITRRDHYAEVHLPIGGVYDVVYKKLGYIDTTVHINTNTSILLTESELDIEMQPSKTNIVVRLIDEDSLYTVPGTIDIRNEDKDEELNIKRTKTHDKLLEVRQGNTYVLHARAKGYVYKDTVLHIPYTYDTITHTIPLTALRKEMVLQLRNIQFDHNSSALTPSSYAELNQLVKLMQDNPSMHIELSAHTDDVGSEQYNQRLSQKRGEAAKHYLVRQGIEAERIVAKGYGKNKPLVPNDSDANRAINRRVEFTINAL